MGAEYGYSYEYSPEDSAEVKNPLEANVETDLNSDFTNDEIRNSLDSDYSGNTSDNAGVDLNYGATDTVSKIMAKDDSGEDLNKYPKDTGDEQLEPVLDNFQEDNWNDLSIEEQKQAMTDLAGCVADDTGNENPPEIIFRNDMPDGSYGGYNPETNTLEINENMLDDSAEAADTVAHEMWHAHQQQCVLDPTNEKGREYKEGFDNYISPEYDFEGYENQMVEAEAREYAQGFKNKLAEMRGDA